MKRRKFIKDSTLSAFSIAAFGAINWNGKSFVGDSISTTDVLGPYYRPGSPMRSNLIPPGSTAEIIHLTGTVFQSDGKTPLANVLIESWQCDENEKYDNTSDDYLLRGAVKTDKNGKYQFKTILPIPYKDFGVYRPAHIHLRISSNEYQDLITQIYVQGDPYIKEDPSASSPQSARRILKIRKNSSDENMLTFDVVMGKSLPLDDAVYKKITGLYRLKNGMVEFTRQDDLLFLKLNGQFMEGLVYKGDNSFEGAMRFNRVKFDFLSNGDVKAKITLWESWHEDMKFLELHDEGIKVFKYSN